MDLDEGHRRTKQPLSAALAGPYGHPFHPILVTVPIGAWVSSLVLDIGWHLVDDGAGLADAARWLIAIGVIGALAAGAVGFMDFLTIPPRTGAHRTAVTHLSVNLAVIVLFSVDWLWRLGDTGPTDWGPIVLSVVGLAALGVSGSLGGRLAYHFGVRVARESDQASGFTERRG